MAKTPKPKKIERPAPAADEAADIKAALANRTKRPVRPRVAVEGRSITAPHSDPMGWTAHLHDSLGTRSYDFAEHVLMRLEPLVRARGTSTTAPEGEINAALAILAAVNPSNELEAAMGEQMVAAHLLSLELMKMARHTETLPKMETYINAATKLSRTFTGQVEALAKLRSGGKQQVIVKHEHIYINGPALVGANAQAVIHGGGERGQITNQSHAPLALADGSGAAMLCEDPLGRVVPIASGEGSEALPDARRDEPGRTEG